MAFVPAAYLDRHDFLGPRLFAAHARYVNTEEVTLLGRSGTIIAHQAGMAANRGISPPIPEQRAAGCPIALGTDNNTNDVFEVMRIAMLTERIRRNRDGDEVPGLQPQPEDVLADCTQGGALAVQQADTLGTRIAKGQNPGRRSRKVIQDCTICASCRLAGPRWIVPRKREKRV